MNNEEIKDYMDLKETMRLCLDKSLKAKTNITVYGSKLDLEKEEKRSEIIVGERIIKEARPIVNLTQDYVFLTLEFGFDNDNDLLASSHLFEVYLQKSTKGFTENNERFLDLYTFVCDLITIEDDYTYFVTLSNPMFKYVEKNKLNFVFSINDVDFSIQDIDYTQIEKEVEYEQKVQEEEYKRLQEKTMQDESDYFNPLG